MSLTRISIILFYNFNEPQNETMFFRIRIKYFTFNFLRNIAFKINFLLTQLCIQVITFINLFFFNFFVQFYKFFAQFFRLEF
jgi:hypothetical protein